MRADLSQPYTSEELAAVRQPLSKASLLPPRAYCDPAIYALEVKRVFQHNWIAAAHISQLSENGSYLSRDVGGEPILLTRDGRGTIRALSNVCRHRNSLVTRMTGQCTRAERVSCPYHSWTYALDGSLVGTQFMQQTEDFSKDKVRLPEAKVEIWKGFIFVNVDGQAAPLGPQLKALDKVLARYPFEDFVCVELESYPVQWNWKVSLENFSEAYHQIAIHPKTAEPYVPAHLAQYPANDGGPYSVFHQPLNPAIPWDSAFPAIEGLSEEDKRDNLVVNVYPMLHLLVDASAAAWLDWNVRSVNDHDLVWRVLVPKSTAELPDFQQRAGKMLSMFSPVWVEDMEACRGVQRGAAAGMARSGRMSYMERAVHEFQNWLVNQFESAPPVRE